MGKGKKKGDKKKEEPKKEEEPTLSSLTLSESQPSTSEDGGLTGGTSKKKSSPPQPAAAPAAEPQPTSIKDEDEGCGLGLGGGTSKKKSGKKVKGGITEAPAASAVLPSQPEPAALPSPPQPAAAPAPEPQPIPEKDEDEGLGLGLGGAKKKRPRKKKETTPEAAKAAVSAPVSAASPPLLPSISSPSFVSPVAAVPSIPSQPPVKTPWGAGPQAAPITAPQGPPGFGTQPSAGRGRGGPMQAGPSPQPAPPGFGSAQPPIPIAQPTPSAQTSQQLTQAVGPRGDVRQPLCLYKIPLKIIGKTVPARPVRVLTNYLPMTIKPLKIFRYDVSFNPEKPKKAIPRAFIKLKEKHFPKSVIAFDQMKNCYTIVQLPNVSNTERFSTQIEILDNNGKTMKFEVSLKFTGIVDLGTIINYMNTGGTSLSPPTEAIQCIDVVLRQGTLESYIKAGRQFFKRPNKPVDLGDGLEMWTGLFQSAIFTSRPFINIDVAHKGFPKNQPLIDTISRDFRLDLNRPLDQQRGRGLEMFLLFIKGLRVIACIGGDYSAKGQKREFICNDLADPPNCNKFTMTDSSGKSFTMTVADYFAREKGVRLRYPNLNCMWVGPRDKKIFYPMEFLEVSYGQALNKKLNENQLSTMVREAATPPDERKRKIDEVISHMKYSQNPYFKQFGLTIQEEFFPVDAKVLTPPKLDVGGPLIDPRNGQWQANRLLKAQAVDSWAFVGIDLDPDRSNAEQIISLLISVGGQMGMRVSQPKERFHNVRMQDLMRVLIRATELKITFVVIVVATRGRDYYHKVKQVAERQVGILTQCIKEYTATRRMNPQTARNILLKVNSKMMGINQALDSRNLPKCLAGGGVMVVGADVTHPSPDQTSIPSIAAVTASIDPKCFIYNIQLSIQTSKKEMIVEFEDMMIEHLKVYRERQRELPKKIFVFRDGVSEGQFAAVMNSELTAVFNAYRRMSGSPKKPEVLFLLVQKRHHTRLFLGSNNPKNVEPGTVVDTHIVHPSELDFYLVSHQAIKGTARPTRYHAVCNDGAIPHDEVEQLTFYLCHLYSRCMRSVSYPTPTYYAHLACARARSLTHGETFDNAALERKPQRLNVLDKMLDFSRMFFV